MIVAVLSRGMTKLPTVFFLDDMTKPEPLFTCPQRDIIHPWWAINNTCNVINNTCNEYANKSLELTECVAYMTSMERCTISTIKCFPQKNTKNSSWWKIKSGFSIWIEWGPNCAHKRFSWERYLFHYSFCMFCTCLECLIGVINAKPSRVTRN